MALPEPTHSSTASLVLGVSFRQHVTIELHADDAVLAVGGCPAVQLSHVPAPVLEVLNRLVERSLPVCDIGTRLSADHRYQLALLLNKLKPWLADALILDGHELASIESTGPVQAYKPASVRLEDPVRLSRFALVRRRGGDLVLESGTVPRRCIIKSPVVAALLVQLACVGNAQTVSTSGIPAVAAGDLFGHLVGSGFAERGRTAEDGSVVFPEDENVALRQWEFHDLYFHSRSRMGRTDEPFGGLFSHLDTVDPLPALKPLPEGKRLQLHKPDLADVLANDSRLAAVLETRRSVRQYAPQPVCASQLGTFLYRTARVRSVHEADPEHGMHYAATSRPYPCGGAAYELELYLTVHRCDGVDPGIYYYDPKGHQLCLIDSDAGLRQELLDQAVRASGGEMAPDVLITITSRFQRLSWKYQSIAYAVTLKNTGVLYQTMYLVATAMGLGPCGLGFGNSETSERAFGLDPFQESSVGEFMLGSVPTSPGQTVTPVTVWPPDVQPRPNARVQPAG